MIERGILLLLFVTLTASALFAAEEDPDWTLVGEMERPEGILSGTERSRQALPKSGAGQLGLARFEARLRALWPQVRKIDLVELSRYQVEATRDFQLGEEPGEFSGRLLEWDGDAKRWHLEVRGPRLPARYDIVHRYLTFYATYDPATETIDRIVVTIRGWVLE